MRKLILSEECRFFSEFEIHTWKGSANGHRLKESTPTHGTSGQSAFACASMWFPLIWVHQCYPFKYELFAIYSLWHTA